MNWRYLKNSSPMKIAMMVAIVVACIAEHGIAGQEGGTAGEIVLIVRSDDMGMTHAVNQACLKSVTDGVARSIEVIVPGPWFAEAAQMLNQHPQVDVGVHLDLTSEWSNVKWGPVSDNVPSLVDANGYFHPLTRQRKGWPPNSGFLESGWKINEVERELRAQIDMALRLLPNVTHLSAHMGTATSSPELRALVGRLAEEYKLPIQLPNLKRAGGLGGRHASAKEKETALIETLRGLKPGLWMFVEHPGLDTPEMQAVGHKGYENVAADRAGVTHAFTSERVKEVVRQRGIKLVSYSDVLKNIPAQQGSKLAATGVAREPSNPAADAASISGRLQVATCQFPVSGDIATNAEWIRRQMREATRQNADIAHFSEAALSGYAGTDFKNLEGFDWDAQHTEMKSILALARSLKLWVVLGATHQLSGSHKPHNSLYVINSDGELIDRYDKRFCTGGDLRHYSPGDHFVTFDVNNVRCGMLICYDIRFPELYRHYKKDGVQLMFHSFYNARQKPGSIHPKIMPPTAQARAASNHMFVSVNNSSAPNSWQSIFITPDGLMKKRLILDEPGVMVNHVDTNNRYYDASGAYRLDSINGKWNSGQTVDDTRSKDRRVY